MKTIEMVCIIIAGTVVFCTIILLTYYIFQRHKRNSDGRQYMQEDSVCDPILNANTIQDMIEMTTSGSGSGE